MIDFVSTRYSNMSGREKVLTTLTMMTLLTYFAYMLTFQPLMADIDTAEKSLSKYDQTRRNIENARGSIRELAKELDRLKADLSLKKSLEEKLNNTLSSGGHTDSVLKSLESSARKMKLELLELKETTNTAQNSRALVPENKGNKHFAINAIRLKFRSSYPAAVEYLVGLADIPYGLSILSVEMSPSSRTPNNRKLLATTIEMELFSK